VVPASKPCSRLTRLRDESSMSLVMATTHGIKAVRGSTAWLVLPRRCFDAAPGMESAHFKDVMAVGDIANIAEVKRAPNAIWPRIHVKTIGCYESTPKRCMQIEYQSLTANAASEGR